MRLTPAARVSGVTLVLATGAALIAAGFLVAYTTPHLSGGHLIAGPLFVTTGGALAARLAFVQARHARTHR